MSQENTVAGDKTETEISALDSTDSEAVTDRSPPPAIESRFLYVDVASQRAKQLRRGALPRLDHLAADPETGVRPVPKSKLERIAMSEVLGRKIYYEVPDTGTTPEKKS